MNVTKLTFLIPLLPGIGAAILGLTWLFGVRLKKSAVDVIACGSVFLSFVLSVLSFLALAKIEEPANRHFVNHLWTWFSFGPFEVPFAFEVDPLSAVMILVVTGIGFLIHVYSTAYMGADAGFQKFMAWLNLFMFAMLILVLGNNFLVMFIGWEGVGLCSWGLIGFWHTDLANAKAAKKAFVVNRVGDFLFISGLMALVWGAGAGTGFYSIVFREMAANPGVYVAAEANVTVLGLGLITFCTLCFFGGATGKSAQIPLFVWLPDAMAGPTPVSALIHAATMVTSGIYMVTRLNFLFSLAPFTLIVVAGVGATTALVAASIGLFQYDIKKVLAYSTVSQLGYMFLGLGAGAYTAGMFHVFTHAFFKALMFLGSGSVIHALHHALPHGVDAQDMRNMGGLRKYMPITAWTFFVGWIAIAGIPPFAGFWSKDEILWKVFEQGPFVIDGPYAWAYLLFYAMGLTGALMTAFYMTRQVAMTFFGEYRGRKIGEAYLAAHPHGHLAPALATATATHGTHSAHDDAHAPAHASASHAAHDDHDDDHGAVHDPEESPFAITFPLMTLAVGSACVGLLGLAAWTQAPNYWDEWLQPVVTRSAPASSPHHATAGLPYATDGVLAKVTTADPTQKVDEHGQAVDAEPAHAAPAHAAPPKHGAAPAHAAPAGEHHGEAGAHHAPVWLEVLLAAVSVLVGLAGIWYGLHLYTTVKKFGPIPVHGDPRIPATRLAQYGPGGSLSQTFPGTLYRWVYNKYYVDEGYELVFVKGSKGLAKLASKFDRNVIDGFVHFLAYTVLVVRWMVGLFDREIVDGLVINRTLAGVTDATGRWIRKAQTGDLQSYLRWIAYGALATTSFYVLILTSQT